MIVKGLFFAKLGIRVTNFIQRIEADLCDVPLKSQAPDLAGWPQWLLKCLSNVCSGCFIAA